MASGDGRVTAGDRGSDTASGSLEVLCGELGRSWFGWARRSWP